MASAAANTKKASKTSGISRKSLYKPAPKENAKAKRTNRKPLAQGQLVDLSNPRSAKTFQNGMKSLLIDTLDRNFLSPDAQRRETISTPGKASSSCRPFDEFDSDSRRSTLVPSPASRAKPRLLSTDELFSPLRITTEDFDRFQSPHRTINLDLSDAEFDEKLNDTIVDIGKENQNNKVDVFLADVLDDPHQNLNNKSFESLDLSVCKENSIAKVICHTPRSAKKKLLGQSLVTDRQKSPRITVSATEIETSSFFDKDTILQNDMNATQIPDDSSESEDDFNKKSAPLEKSVSKGKKKGRIVPSRYMQSARNFVATKTPVKKDANKSHNVTLSRGNSKNTSSVACSSFKTTSEDPGYNLATTNHQKSKSEDGNNNAQTSTPNKDDLPMPYSDASTIMQDISTISEADKTVRRDLFQLNVKNQDPIPLFPIMEQEKKGKPIIDQMDLEILHSQYIRSVYLNTMFQHSFQKREEEAMIQMHGLWSEMENLMKKKSTLELKLSEEEHNKVVSMNAQFQSTALELVDSALPDLIPNHQHLAAALDTTRHQIASHGIHLPKDDEVFTDELIASLQETEQLLKKTNDLTGENVDSLSLYSSVLKELTETASQENNEIEKLDEILAATESLTVHQASLNIQEIQDLCTIAFQLNI